MNKRKKVVAAIGGIMVMVVSVSSPALAFGHTATPVSECAKSDMALDNPKAEERNPFSDTKPIPAKSDSAQPNCK